MCNKNPQTQNDSDDWTPEPAELRKGETTDESSHAERTAAMKRDAARELADDEHDRLPWCPDCEAIAVPEDGACGKCGTAVEYREGEQ
jgi:hypothetical protein